MSAIGLAIKTAEVAIRIVTKEETEQQKKAREDREQKEKEQQEQQQLQNQRIEQTKATARAAMLESTKVEQELSRLSNSVDNAAEVIARIKKLAETNPAAKEFLKIFTRIEADQKEAMAAQGQDTSQNPRTIAENIISARNQGNSQNTQVKTKLEPLKGDLYFSINTLENMQTAFDQIELDKAHMPNDLVATKDAVRLALADLRRSSSQVSSLENAELKNSDKLKEGNTNSYALVA